MVEPPDLKIPPSNASVSVRIIDTSSHIEGIAFDAFITPIHPSLTHVSCPAFSFLVEHPSGRKLLFDLGVRKDHENLAPRIVQRFKDGGWTITVEKGVRDQLEENGVSGEDIEAIIWSHWHWDHTGDPSTFPFATSLIVGPGFKSTFLTHGAYPTNPNSPLLDTDFTGREVQEVEFRDELTIGGFKALDYFGDGSFYILDAPGHAVGHLCALARVKSTKNGKDSFIFMGGDAAHHGGEFRPSEYLPLPDSISPNPFSSGAGGTMPCPGAIFEPLLRDGDRTKAFFGVSDLPDGKSVAHDVKETERTIGKVQEVDAERPEKEEVLVVMAHDGSLVGVVDFFPKYADEFVEKGWVKEARWKFLRDFEGDVVVERGVREGEKTHM